MPLLSDVLENPFLQDWFKAGEATGEARGEARGEAKGRAEEAYRFMSHLLERRFGPLPDWAKDKLRAASPETLESAFDRALDAETLERALDFPNPGPPQATT